MSKFRLESGSAEILVLYGGVVQVKIFVEIWQRVVNRKHFQLYLGVGNLFSVRFERQTLFICETSLHHRQLSLILLVFDQPFIPDSDLLSHHRIFIELHLWLRALDGQFGIKLSQYHRLILRLQSWQQ